VIPLSDHNPVNRKALLVPLIIAANVIVFLFLQPSFAGSDREGQIEQLEFNVCHASIPYEVMHLEPLAEGTDLEPGSDAALFAEFQGSRCPGKSVWFSILASLFFHGGLLHLAGNMLFLWVFGNNIEDRLGPLKFVLFYLVSGVAATYAQSVFSPDSPIPLIGASGAIAGILGAYLVLYPRARIKTLIVFVFITVADLPAVFVLGAWFVLQIFQSVGPGSGGGVAYLAHVGGFAAGMALIMLFRPERRQRLQPW
jgi:membrane associated rhomboid family serine protease